MNTEQSKGLYVSDGGPGGVAGGKNEQRKTAPQESPKAFESARDALQREIVAIIKGASDYAKRHQRDDGTLGLKQIELTVPGPKETHEVINIGYFGSNPEASQLIIEARPLKMYEIPYPTALMREHIYGGFLPRGQEVIDYIFQQGQEEVPMEINKYKTLHGRLNKRDLYEKQSGVASEDDIQKLREKMANSTIEGENGWPDIQVSTLLQKDTPPASNQ